MGNVIKDRRDPFVVTYLERGTNHPDIGEEQTVTFSLVDWQGELEPRKDQVVILGDVHEFRNGWRALTARPVTLKNTENRKVKRYDRQ